MLDNDYFFDDDHRFFFRYGIDENLSYQIDL